MKINLNPEEIEVLLDLSLDMTGIQSESPEIKNYVIENVKKRMLDTKTFYLKNYLNLINKNQEEYQKFLSAITVHTTGWYREIDHFSIIYNEIVYLYNKLNIKFIRILSIPCSTGEEVYSLAFLLEYLCEELPGLNYEIYGLDIDLNSIQKCKNAIYLKTDLDKIPEKFQKYVLMGSGDVEKHFAISKNIREHCSFFNGDIRDENFLNNTDLFRNQMNSTNYFDIILCRNLFIYFDSSITNNIISKFNLILREGGLICLGHSEKIEEKKHDLIHIKNSIYKKQSTTKLNSDNENSVEEVILYSNAELNKINLFTERIKKEFKTFKIINSVENLKESIENKKVKILIVDRNSKSHELIQYIYTLSKMNKNIFILESILYPTNSEIKNLDVFHESQIFKDFLDWRNFDAHASQIVLYLKKVLSSLENASKNYKTASSENKKVNQYLENLIPSFIAIGASTGGTIALIELLKNISERIPPILIVQHLPHIFAKEFIDKLKKVSGLKYVSPLERPVIKPGHIYMADGDNHIVVKGQEGHLRVEPDMSPPKKELRPCVDILFESLAKTKAKGVGILLTGMGNDGAQGLLKLMQNGSLTMTQDESSCVIYGMPKEAELLGASCYSGNLLEIRKVLNNLKVKK